MYTYWDASYIHEREVVGGKHEKRRVSKATINQKKLTETRLVARGTKKGYAGRANERASGVERASG